MVLFLFYVDEMEEKNVTIQFFMLLFLCSKKVDFLP